MLSNYDLKRIAGELKLPLVDVVSKDELKGQKRQLGSWVINLQDEDKGSGSHWVFLKIFSDKLRDDNSSEDVDTSDEDDDEYKLMEKKHEVGAIYFDPFGVYMPKDVLEFVKPLRPKVVRNDKQIQNINSSQCGWYCLACDYCLEHKQFGKTYFDDFRRFLEMFDEDPKKNLTILKAFFKPL